MQFSTRRERSLAFRRKFEMMCRRHLASCFMWVAGRESLAHADPQFNVSSSLGVGATTGVQPAGPVVALGVHGDALFGPPKSDSFRFGPTLSLHTENFSDFTVAALGSLSIPALRSFPVVASAGPHLYASELGRDVGITGRMFWGLREPLESGSTYSVAFGGWFEVHTTPELRTTQWLIGADLDAIVPFVLVFVRRANH